MGSNLQKAWGRISRCTIAKQLGATKRYSIASQQDALMVTAAVETASMQIPKSKSLHDLISNANWILDYAENRLDCDEMKAEAAELWEREDIVDIHTYSHYADNMISGPSCR